MVKYGVRLNTEAREQLRTLVNTGRAAAVQLLHARIFLTAAVDAGERHWTEAEIAEALDPRASPVQRVRQAWVAQGLQAALSRQLPTGRQSRTLDGAQEAQLMAVACRAPPAGRARWTRKGLAEKLVALHIVDTIRPEWVRTTLKKTRCNRGSSKG